jgi:hypothetical protein
MRESEIIRQARKLAQICLERYLNRQIIIHAVRSTCICIPHNRSLARAQAYTSRLAVTSMYRDACMYSKDDSYSLLWWRQQNIRITSIPSRAGQNWCRQIGAMDGWCPWLMEYRIWESILLYMINEAGNLDIYMRLLCLASTYIYSLLVAT